MTQPLHIAIDGPAASGKTTVAHLLAQRFGIGFVDTGAMYRALALLAIRRSIDPRDGPVLAQRVDDALAVASQASEESLQSEDVTAIVSTVAAHAAVRAAMVAAQRRVAEGRALVMAGRDIGTVVLPDAPVKIYLTASVAARVARRQAQLARVGVQVDAARLCDEIEARDRLDTTRAVSPLEPASDAHRIDSSDLPVEGVVDEICAIVKRTVPSAG